MSATILLGQKGEPLAENLRGAVVGYDDDDRLTVATAGVELLGPTQRRRLADELIAVAEILRRGQPVLAH